MPVYDAFISYSHAKDKPIAAALQSVIQKLGKPWYRRRALRVFRDDTSLSATPQLWPSIELALSQSRYLLLLASPEAADSHWVGKEVDYWLTHKSADTLLIGVTDGTLTWSEKRNDFNAKPKPPLPPVLKGKFAAEPKWVDLTRYRDGADPRDARFIELGADFAAAIHGTPKEDLLSQEVRQQKRALRLAVSAAGVMLLLAAGAVTAGIIARSQQLRAEKNFAAAKDTVDSLIFNIAQGLRNVEGMRVETIDKILGQVRSTVERLAATDPGNIALMRSRDVMLDEFAKTYISAGQLEAALKAAEESLGSLRKTVAAQGMDDGLAQDMVVALLRIGDIKRAQGDAAAALAAYEESLALSRRLADAYKTDGKLQYAMTPMLDRIGDLRLQQGQHDKALAAFEESLAIRRGLVAKDGGNAEWQRGVLVSLGKICDVKRDVGDRDGALAACEESLATARRLAGNDKDNTDWQRDIAISLERLAGLKLSAGDAAGALTDYEEGLQLRRHLAALDPGNTLWQRDVLTGLAAIGDIKLRQGDLKAALANYEESLVLARKLAAADPSNSQWQRDVSVALDKIGYVKLALGDKQGALAAAEESMEVTRRLADADPNDATLLRDLSVGLNKIGDVKTALGDLDGALAAYQQSATVARQLIRIAPDNLTFQRDLEFALDKLGDVKRAKGDLAGARETYEESLAITQKLSGVDRANVQWLTDLVVALYKVALVTDGDKRRESVDEALKIVETLESEGKLSPDKKNWKDMLIALRDQH
jgi:tetratricopeptide (TPR) repeat protein